MKWLVGGCRGTSLPLSFMAPASAALEPIVPNLEVLVRRVAIPSILLVLIGLVILGSSSSLSAQTEGVAPPPADPADVESVDAIVAAVYDVISGPAGEARDWDRWRSLFLPEGRIISVGRTAEGTNRPRVMTPEDYVQGAGPGLQRNGFFEDEIGRTQEEFGPVVHLFSAYQSKRTAQDPEPFARGINSFQVMHDGSRWWIVTIFFTSERPDLPIPPRYLRGGAGR